MAVSRTLVAVAVIVVMVGVWAFTSEDAAPPAKTAPRGRVAKDVKGADWDLPPPDPKLHFPPMGGMPRNAFVPLVTVDKPLPIVKALPPHDDLMEIPGTMAGEGGWAYTGLVEANGVRMALLENKAKRQAGYVHEGDLWKKARIVGIASACIVLADEKGATETVYRFDPNAPPKVKPVTGGSFGPGGVGGVRDSGSPISGPIQPFRPGAAGTSVRPFSGDIVFPRTNPQENG